MTTTERLPRHAETEIRSLERLLATVLAVVDAGIVICDEQGRFIMASPSFMTQFRWKGRALPEHTFASLFPDITLPNSQIRLPRSVSAGRFTTRIRTGDGRLAEIEVHARWITQDDENSYWVAAVTPAVLPAEPPDRGNDPHPAGDSPSLCGRDQFGEEISRRTRSSPSHRHLMAGQVQIVNLDPVRQVAGERWPRVASHIFSVAEAIISRHLSAADTFTHDGQGRFTIGFGDAMLDEAERRADTIEREIRDRLMGQFGVTAAPDVEAEADRIALPPGNAPVPDLAALIAAKVAEKRALVEKLASMALPQVVEAAQLELAEIVHQGGGLAPLVVAQVDRIAGRALQKIASLSGTTAEVAGQVDHLLLGLAAAKLYESLAGHSMPALVVPVSFTTFTHRRLAERYLGLCRTLLKGTAKSLFFELYEVPDDAANQRVEDIVTGLRPFSRAQWLRVSRLDALPAKGWLRHFSQVTILYPNLEALLRHQPERFRAGLHALHVRRCRLLVHRVPSQTVARHLADTGVDFVSGAGVVPWDEAMVPTV